MSIGFKGYLLFSAANPAVTPAEIAKKVHEISREKGFQQVGLYEVADTSRNYGDVLVSHNKNDVLWKILSTMLAQTKLVKPKISVNWHKQLNNKDVQNYQLKKLPVNTEKNVCS